MKRILFFLFIIPFLSFSQVDFHNLQKQSLQVFAFKISAIEAEKYIDLDSINIDAYTSVKPYAVFSKDSVDEDKLPTGHYVLISVEDNKIIAQLTGVSNLYVYTINNQHRVQLLVRDKQGNFINDAKVWVNKKLAYYNVASGSYIVKQKYPDLATVKICTSTDTLFASLYSDDDYNDKSIAEQRWVNFKQSRLYYIVNWIPRKMSLLFKEKNKNYNSYYSIGKGLIVFNQPKYKLTDTVKFKAYVYNRKSKQYNHSVNVYLEYSANDKQYNQLLAQLKPSAPGSFIFQFPLNDTLKTDNTYRIVLRDDKNRKLISSNFKIEDYLLDEVTKVALRSDKETYYSNDTMHFYVSANDANGLSLLDAKAKLVLTTTDIDKFFSDSLYIPDTLFSQEKILKTEGETEFVFPADKIQNANIDINATVFLNNSNNEMQQAEKNISYKVAQTELLATLNEDSISVNYFLNGKNKDAVGIMKMDGEIEETKTVHFPLIIKADPIATGYSFYVLENGNRKDSAEIKIESYYQVPLSRISTSDTLGFSLYNAKKIPVSFTVFYGNKIIGSGKDDKENIVWKFIPSNKNRAYKVKWQYVWGGEEKTQEQTIALLYKILDVEIQSASSVFPGQKDTIHIDVKDYRNKPASNVNLTAVSYNSQFKNDINVHEPPYMATYHLRPSLMHSKFEQDDGYMIKRYPLGKHIEWLQKLGLDSFTYYKMLFPSEPYKDFVSPIGEFTPQLSMHVSDNGERQEIYMLYINNEIVYYNGVTDKMKDAYSCFPGYVKIGIRLFDKYIETDSIYIQPFYKHDIFLDLAHLPSATTVNKMPDSLTAQEKYVLGKSIWQLDNRYLNSRSYVWESDRLFEMSNARKHIVGPFVENDKLHFFAPDNFDIDFVFEPGYEYNLSNKISRLEKNNLFVNELLRTHFTKPESSQWILGDTIVPPPIISYKKPADQPYLYADFSYQYMVNKSSNGSIHFTIPKDTVPRYLILFSKDSLRTKLILDENLQTIRNIEPGNYSFLVVAKDFTICEVPNIAIKADSTFCFHSEKYSFQKTNVLYDAVVKESSKLLFRTNTSVVSDNTSIPRLPEYEKGIGIINGKIIDNKGGHGVPFASIMIKGTRTGTSSNASGNFSIKSIKTGSIKLLISAIGYQSKEVTVEATEVITNSITIKLEVSTQNLNEVVVVGYGISRSEKSLGYSVTTSVHDNLLSGKVSGLEVSNLEGSYSMSDSTRITLRGNRSISDLSTPIYIVDGIMYEKMPENVTPEMIANVSILKSSEATAIYGSKAMDGAVIITTKTKTSRTQFRDYALWQPQLFTDENGKASFVAEYPDNITGWETFVLGMDKKRRIGEKATFVKSYKPILAELSMPQFLIAGDSVQLVGKSLNYTSDAYSVKSLFSIYGTKEKQNEFLLQPKASVIQKYGITASLFNDTLSTSFSLQTSTGFKDGEERKIPLLPQGTEETTGNFWLLQNDTTVTFNADTFSDKIELYAENNTLDILLDEIDYLKKYPYYCYEQTASKLRGLLMEKKIKEVLKQPFTDEKILNFLLQKIQKGQLYDGSWSWWDNGRSNIFITNYVINALLPLRSDPLIETNIRNGLLYLQNNLINLKKDELLNTLVTMSNAHHLIDYKSWIQKINFDSLSQYGQWQWVKLNQQQNGKYENELKALLNKAIPGILGSIHWGEENFRWYSDDIASTIAAFEVLQNEKGYDKQLKGIMQYFLEQRKTGYWINTVQSASIVSTILPYILLNNPDFQQPSVLKIAGDTSFTVNEYPYKISMDAKHVKSVTINKSGGGLDYLTLYQHYWNNSPEPVMSSFKLNTYFEKNGNQIESLAGGEKTKMILELNAMADADYVMIEIPIPAGCTYSEKNQDVWDGHKEYLKNKIVLFAEHISKGTHQFEIELEPRYTGLFTINPAKASLMYFPVFYGRNEMKKIKIE